MKILKNLVDILRIFLSLVIFYFIIKKIALGWSNINTVIMVLIVYLPALFLLVFKSKYLVNHPKLLLTYKIVRIFLIIWLIAFAVLFFGRWSYLNKTQSALDRINNAKITMDDVMGTNLPPAPNKTLNDSTIAGFDVNNNGIRDDVELAIFEKYPDSAKIRAGMLQYAQALQLELTQIISQETLKVVMQKESNGRFCIDNAGPEINLKTDPEVIKEAMALTDNRKKEVDEFVFNTDLRLSKQSDVYSKYMTTYPISFEKDCDINLSTLSN